MLVALLLNYMIILSFNQVLHIPLLTTASKVVIHILLWKDFIYIYSLSISEYFSITYSTSSSVNRV